MGQSVNGCTLSSFHSSWWTSSVSFCVFFDQKDVLALFLCFLKLILSIDFSFESQPATCWALITLYTILLLERRVQALMQLNIFNVISEYIDSWLSSQQFCSNLGCRGLKWKCGSQRPPSHFFKNIMDPFVWVRPCNRLSKLTIYGIENLCSHIFVQSKICQIRLCFTPRHSWPCVVSLGHALGEGECCYKFTSHLLILQWPPCKWTIDGFTIFRYLK